MTDYQEYVVRVYKDRTEWKKDGKYHREDGPAIELANGHREWYLNDELHREDGPAVEFRGYKEWYKEGKRHREDGPAIEDVDGYKAWYLNGEKYSEEEYLAKTGFCEGKVVEIDGKKYKLVKA